jgi:hypothetical protein
MQTAFTLPMQSFRLKENQGVPYPLRLDRC